MTRKWIGEEEEFKKDYPNLFAAIQDKMDVVGFSNRYFSEFSHFGNEFAAIYCHNTEEDISFSCEGNYVSDSEFGIVDWMVAED